MLFGLHDFFRPVDDLIHIVHRDESGGVRLGDEADQLDVLLLGDNNDNLLPRLPGIGPHRLIEAGSAVQGVENEAGNLLLFLRHDAHPFFDVHAEDEVVQHDAAQVGAQDAEGHGLHVGVDEHGLRLGKQRQVDL